MVMFSQAIIIYEMFTVEMCMTLTLTFRMGQGQMQMYTSEKQMW